MNWFLRKWEAREEWENISRGNVASIKYLSITKFSNGRGQLKGHDSVLNVKSVPQLVYSHAIKQANHYWWKEKKETLHHQMLSLETM